MSRVSSLGPLTSTREPFLVRPFQAGMTGWIVVFGAIIVELAGGALTYSKFVGAALPVLIIPVAVAYGFGIVQWWQVRRAGADPAELGPPRCGRSRAAHLVPMADRPGCPRPEHRQRVRPV